ncbi:MAG: YIP1 family protein [Myxococcota bacterium]
MAKRLHDTFARLAERADQRRAFFVVLAGGLGWAGLYLMLALGGEAPSRVLLPIDRGHYYFFEALMIGPWLVGLWLVGAELSLRVGRWLGGDGSRGAVRAVLAPAQAVPLLLCLVLPETLAYLAFGFPGLGKVARVAGPVLLLLTFGLVGIGLAAALRISRPRAFGVAALVLIAQGVLSGPLVR